MKRLLLLLFLFSFLLPRIIFATVIKADDANYAGQTLRFSVYTDPVTKQASQLFLLVFNNAGKGTANVNISEATFAFCDFGIYRGMIFLEADKTIDIELPPVREKSFADQKNPFFEPVAFWFNSNSETTKAVADFDVKFNQLTNKYLNQLFYQQSKSVYDSVVLILNSDLKTPQNEIFQLHKKLKIKTLEADVFRLQTEDVSPVLSTIPYTYWKTPAFIELFEKIFNNKLSFDVKEIKGAKLKEAIAQKNISLLFTHIKTIYKLEGETAELVALKMLYDGFYSGDFAKSSILILLQSNKLSQSNSTTIREITQIVIEKLKFLLPGAPAPAICLLDIDGNKQCSDQNKEKFKYLVFADTEMLVCREQLKYLIDINQQFQKYLEIILVMRKTDLIEMKMFLDKNKIPGVQLIDKNGEYINKYHVRSFPTCLLLDKNHHVIFSEAKAPLDGFQQQFGTFLRNELFERQRNQSR